jgi:hypothetical protein
VSSFKLRILPQLVLDLAISSLFVLVSMFLLKFVLPDGSTTTFFYRSYKFIGLVLLILGIIFVILLIKVKNFKFKQKFNFPQPKDLLLISLPMSPIIGFIITNLEYLDAIGFLYVIGIPLVFSLIFSFILPVLFSYFSSFKMLMIAGLALSFTVSIMPSITENLNSHLFNSQFVTQVAYLILSFTILYLFYSFNKTTAYTIAIVFMLTGAMSNILSKISKNESAKTPTADRLKIFMKNENNRIIDNRNIYIIAYESYPNLETLKFYGYDNTKQIKFLENNNYSIYHGSYSQGGSSIESISRMLDINSKISKNGRYYLSGNAFGLDVFKANGYKIKSLFPSPYFFSSHPITWDEYYPKDNVSKLGGKTITKAIFEGRFRFDIFDDNYNYDEYLRLKNKYLSSNAKKPTLFYTHNSYPGHSGNSGKCLPDEKQRYFKRLNKANIEMINDVKALKKNDPKAIVVLLGDHGPALTKNCRELRNFKISSIDKYDIQDRYGTFLAIHEPKDLVFEGGDVQLIQDIFPAILTNITNNKQLFNELKLERKFFGRFNNRVGGVNILDGIIIGGKDDGKPLFEKRSYQIKE